MRSASQSGDLLPKIDSFVGVLISLDTKVVEEPAEEKYCDGRVSKAIRIPGALLSSGYPSQCLPDRAHLLQYGLVSSHFTLQLSQLLHPVLNFNRLARCGVPGSAMVHVAIASVCASTRVKPRRQARLFINYRQLEAGTFEKAP